MTFNTDIARFVTKVIARSQAIHLGTADALHESIRFGSSVTGSPGQPEQDSDLLNSWQLTHTEPLLSNTTTPSAYARIIEEGRRKGKTLTLRSEVGGFHSVKLTRAGFQKLVNAVVREVI